MAQLHTSATALTLEVFTMAARVAKTDAEAAVIDTEFSLEMLYQIRMARRRMTDCSRYSSPALQHIAGWN